MLEVLQTKRQIGEARKALIAKGRSAMTSRVNRWLGALLFTGQPALGDLVKSWDVGRTLDLIGDRLSPDARILDLGAYCSEVPVALAQMGFNRVHGIDLNPRVLHMPEAQRVAYQVGDFTRMPYETSSFDAITAISVIEHGYQPEALFSEIGRVLRPGGVFIASFDYWPVKVDTGTTKFFDLSWLIFSQEDVQHLIDVAGRYGLAPLGEVVPQALERTINCAGFDYTFAWLVLQKT